MGSELQIGHSYRTAIASPSRQAALQVWLWEERAVLGMIVSHSSLEEFRHEERRVSE